MSTGQAVQALQVWVTSPDGQRGMVVPNPVVVTASDTMLKFVMKSPGFVFHKDRAIEVVDPQGSFVGSWTVTEPREAILLDLNTVRGDFEYWVNVNRISSGGGVSTSEPIKLEFEVGFDPTIKNYE